MVDIFQNGDLRAILSAYLLINCVNSIWEVLETGSKKIMLEPCALRKVNKEQAGAELCQVQHSLSLDLYTN